MSKERILILDQQSINWKLERMAYQIWEHNSQEKQIIMIGVEHTGLAVAKELARRLGRISPLEIDLLPLKMNKKNPLQDLADIPADLNDKAVVLVDDVANSGKTLLYAMKPLMKYEPSRIMLAVLVDRQHKSFPVSPDIVGHTIATTLQEHIEVECHEDGTMAAYLL
ncbi:phosphoribosyltransferase family protein [Chitinophagaceae bacterium MMS25-I14]